MNDQVHVFVGPSLPRAARSEYSELLFHPPVSQGDVYHLAKARPLAIAIIDGYFEHRASVWHKELLWALSQGVHLFGAASMGALRAAELCDFGMVGVGSIYERFVSGALTDDDEVTLVHADADLDFRAVSDAMVNLRATLTLACTERILTQGQAERLETALKLRFYPERSYGALLELARAELPRDVLARFEAWLALPEHRVDQKQRDARELLACLRAFRATRPAPLRVPWTFQHTDAWEQVRRSVAPGSAQPAEHAAVCSETVARARLRALEIESALRDGYVPNASDIERATIMFRRERGLLTPESLRAFLERAGLSLAAFEQLMVGEACVQRSRLAPSYDLDRQLADLPQLETRVESRDPS